VKTFSCQNALATVWLTIAFGTTALGYASGSELPPLATGSEAVRKVFDVGNVRPLQSSSFESLRKYFSAKQQKNIEEFLHTQDQLIEAKDRLAKQAGIKQQWWWPKGIGVEVHVITKNDLLTDRSTRPDKLRISAPQLLNAKLEITVKEVYTEMAADGTNLGGTKISKVMLVPENHRWVIDEVAFQTRQYGRVKTETLTEILTGETKQLRAAWQKIEHGKVE
jgi:hypothetical protein